MLNGNDYLGMDTLMNNAVWASLAILSGDSPAKVNHASYILAHVALDLIFIVMLALSLFLLIKAIKTQSVDSSKQESIRKRIVKIILNILGYILWPLFLLTFTKLLFANPLWIVKAFVPDFYGVIIASALLAGSGGVIKLIRKILEVKEV